MSQHQAPSSNDHPFPGRTNRETPYSSLRSRFRPLTYGPTSPQPHASPTTCTRSRIVGRTISSDTRQEISRHRSRWHPYGMPGGGSGPTTSTRSPWGARRHRESPDSYKQADQFPSSSTLRGYERTSSSAQAAEDSGHSCRPEDIWRDPWNASWNTEANRRGWLGMGHWMTFVRLSKAGTLVNEAYRGEEGADYFNKGKCNAAESHPSIPGCETCFACSASLEIGGKFVKIPKTSRVAKHRSHRGETQLKDEDDDVCCLKCFDDDAVIEADTRNSMSGCPVHSAVPTCQVCAKSPDYDLKRWAIYEGKWVGHAGCVLDARRAAHVLDSIYDNSVTKSEVSFRPSPIRDKRVHCGLGQKRMRATMLRSSIGNDGVACQRCTHTALDSMNRAFQMRSHAEDRRATGETSTASEL